MEDQVNHSTKWVLWVLTLVALLTLVACGKKVAPASKPAPPTVAAPTATLSASPESIEQGQTSTLTWTTSNANEVNIEGLGKVDASGSKSVSPSQSTTYHLTAKGDGGSTDATARVTVAAPPVETPTTPAQESATEQQLFASKVTDLYFDYDKYDVRAEDKLAIRQNSAFFAAHANIKFTIEGHCDERGSTEYNLALGDNRANAAKQALIAAGVSADRIRTISYGKEKPVCTQATEECWQKNRRAHFVYGQK
jgi:peptidoglycan-associated lipoprotein